MSKKLTLEIAGMHPHPLAEDSYLLFQINSTVSPAGGQLVY